MSPSALTPIRRVLLLRTGHIGDVVLMLPALELLGRLFPGAEFSALVRAGTEPVLEHHPLIQRIYTGGVITSQQQMLTRRKASAWSRLKQVPRGLGIIRKLRRERFDLAVDFSGHDRTALYTFFSGAAVRVALRKNGSGFFGRTRLYTHLGPCPAESDHKVMRDLKLLQTVAQATGRDAGLVESPSAPAAGALHCSDHDRAWAQDYWRQLPARTGPRLVVHPTSRVHFKCWPGERWTALIDRLTAEFGAQIVVTSGPGEQEISFGRKIVADCRGPVNTQLGGLTLGRLAALIQQSNLFLGVDTAPMHIAAAVGIRVVAVFGPSSHEVWGPWGKGHCVVRRPCPCLESGKRGCNEARGMDCLMALTADEVYQAVVKTLGPLPAVAGRLG